MLKEKGAELMNETCKGKLVEAWDERYTCDSNVSAHESTDKPLTHQTSVLVHSDWPRIKEDEVNLALQELLVRKEKESLSLSGLQLAFGFMRVPDNVSSNLRQLLWVTQARPLLCHELSLLSSEANPQKSPPPQQNNTDFYCFMLLLCSHSIL